MKKTDEQKLNIKRWKLVNNYIKISVKIDCIIEQIESILNYIPEEEMDDEYIHDMVIKLSNIRKNLLKL